MNHKVLLIATAIMLPKAALAGPSPICTDRPTKANAVCTVPAGTLQVESSLVGWSLTNIGGARSELVTLGSSVAKLGLSAKSDLQVGITPLARVTVQSGGERSRASGFGDVLVRYKRRLTRDGARIQAGIIPFVKLPTARSGLGNGKVEGGVAVPVSFAAGTVTVTFGPELNLLADADGGGHHLAVVNLMNFAVPAADRLTFIGEVWTSSNFEPAGTVRQASADAALAYLVSSRLQLDAGANLGLTRDTPDIELYAGVSARF